MTHYLSFIQDAIGWVKVAVIAVALLAVCSFIAVESRPTLVCINPGAQCQIYLSSFADMDKAADHELRNLGGLTVFGNDGKPKAIYLPAGADQSELVRLTAHELLKHGGPDIFARIATKDWNPYPCAEHR